MPLLISSFAKYSPYKVNSAFQFFTDFVLNCTIFSDTRTSSRLKNPKMGNHFISFLKTNACHSQISVSFLTIIQGKLNPQNKVSSKLFLLCQIVISDNKLENFDDSSAYTRILSLEHLLIFKRISCKRQISLSVHLLVIRGRRKKFLKLLWGGGRQRHIQTWK